MMNVRTVESVTPTRVRALASIPMGMSMLAVMVTVEVAIVGTVGMR